MGVGENEKGRNEVQMLLNTYSRQGGTSNVNPAITDKRRKSSVFFMSPHGVSKLEMGAQ